MQRHLQYTLLILKYIHIDIPREDSVVSLLNSYLDLNFEVIKRADTSRNANGNDIRLVNLAPIALFTNFKLATSSGEHLEDISQSHIVSLMYKLITLSRCGEDLSTAFDHSRNRRRDELAPDKDMKGKFHRRIMLKNAFGFAECQEKALYGLAYELTLTRNKDDAVIDKAAGTADARIKLDHTHWYRPHYTPSTQQQSILSKQILIRTPTELTDKLNDLFF